MIKSVSKLTAYGMYLFLMLMIYHAIRRTGKAKHFLFYAMVFFAISLATASGSFDFAILFMTFCIISALLLVIGLIKPSWVLLEATEDKPPGKYLYVAHSIFPPWKGILRWGGSHITRSKVVKIYGTAMIIFFVASILASSGSPQIPTKTEKPVSPDEFKNSCITLAFDELARHTEAHIGKHIYLRGKVLQAEELWGNNMVLRVAMTEDKYGLWTDAVWVNYTRGERVLEDDIVKIWGIVKGRKTYKAILGNYVTVPEIDAKFLMISR
ncbi:MAG TPA: hypothetical protein GXX51_00490 [Firmicutes bacterium]|nr:hypothetical protein [Bacillota bacterium]